MLRPILPLLALGAAVAADPATAPLVDVVVHDLPRTSTRFAASPYGAKWNAPALAQVRKYVDAELHGQGIDEGWATVIAAWDEGLTGGAWQVGMQDRRPTFALELRGDGLFKRLTQRGNLDLSGWTEAGGAMRFAGFGAQDVKGMRLAPAGGEDDITLRWHPQAIADLFSDGGAAVVSLIVDMLPAGDLGLRLVGGGLRSEVRFDATPAGLIPLDPQAWAPVPASATGLWAVGLDGNAWYQAHESAIDAAFAAADPTGKARSDVDAALGMFGIDGGLEGVCTALSGTVVVAFDNGLPLYGGFTLGLPSTPGMDRIVQSLLGLAGMVPPAEGKTALVGFNVPVPEARRITLGGISVAKLKGRWWLATDALFMDELMRGDTPRFAATPAGLALAKAAVGAHLVGVADGRQFGRLGILGTSAAGSMLGDGRHGAALTQAAIDLARTMGPSVISGRTRGGGFVVAGEGLDGGFAVLAPSTGGAMIPMIAAIAIPNLLESRKTSYESAAAAALKSGYLPAMVVFQSGCYVDSDGDGLGEYGFPGEMAGDPLPGLPDGLSLLAPIHRAAIPEVSGYRYYVFLPAKDGAAIAAGTPRPAEGADLRERYFVVYALPASPSTGRRCFAMDQRGTVFSMLSPGNEPPPVTWNLLYGDKGWGAEAALPWRPYRR